MIDSLVLIDELFFKYIKIFTLSTRFSFCASFVKSLLRRGMVLLARNSVLAVALTLGAFIMISLMLYITVDSNAKRRQPTYGKGIIADENSDIQILRERVEILTSRVQNNKEMLNRLTGKVADVIEEPKKNAQQQLPEIANKEMKSIKEEEDRQQIPAPAEIGNLKLQICPSDYLNLAHNSSSDVLMLNVYDILPFDNPDGGAWKQGWSVEYDNAKIKNEERLEIIVVPHSHNDPGWLKTFEGYFEDQTRHILDYMVTFLSENVDMKFIYAEMSFFELWWSQQSLEIKAKVKKLLEKQQFEIVTGGWVMTDEANAHYFSTIMELFEGHEFLRNQLDYVPNNHWSIDPFGLSPTLAYILNRANISHMVIQRVHYSVKKHLAQTKQLEFIWRQLFAGNAQKTDIITHMFPFYSYDVPHSCGPNPMVCCQFDFRRMGQMVCPWGKNAIPITSENVAERSELLVDQYRKKAQLYGFNTLLVPLGDDFRYDVSSEWTDQYSNYKKLFDYMNANAAWNVNARFGTLADYFELLHQRMDGAKARQENQEKEGKLRHSIVHRHPSQALPILTGDFFTYADRDDHYWSGYFTSRPFYKHMDRSLQHYLRTADIFLTLANWKGQMPTNFESMYNQLVNARRSMSLFQHHDGVTGTAKTHVMNDYGEKMVEALSNSKRIIASIAQFLLTPNANMATAQGEKGFHVDEEHFVNRLPEKFVTEDGSIVIVANSLGQSRTEVVCLHVNNIKSRISKKEQKAEEIQQQIGPILYVDSEGNLAHFREKFELCFLAELTAFGFVRFDIIESEDLSHKVKIGSNSKFESNAFEVKSISLGEKVKLSNEYLDAIIDPSTGYLKSVQKHDGLDLDVQLSFIHYGARPRNPTRRDGGDSLSGAYLFLPDGPSTELPTDKNLFVLVKGPIRQYLHLKGPSNVGIRHQISLDISAEFLTMLNLINLAVQTNTADRGDREAANNGHLSNYELAMRIRVPSITEDNFFTDLNGFQMIRRRRRLNKLPIQAHFYPMPGSAFVEDAHHRVSLLGRQALGVASLESGEMQVMLDRRLDQDDDRGLGQGVEDNLVTESRFHLFVEPFSAGRQRPVNGTVGFHSLAAHHASLQLHYPPVVLIGQLDHLASSELHDSFSGIKVPFPCDIHPVALRTLSQPTIYSSGSAHGSSTSPKGKEAALVLHRLGLECTLISAIPNGTCPFGTTKFGNNFDLTKIFHHLPRSIRRGSLTLLHIDEEKEVADGLLEMESMELATVKIEY